MPSNYGPRPRMQAPTAAVKKAAASLISRVLKSAVFKRKSPFQISKWKKHKRTVNKSLFASKAKHKWSKFKVKSKHQFRRFY